MTFARIASVLLLGAAALPGQQLPELKTEAVAGGSVFHVINKASSPLTAYLIELVDYPGSSYTLFQEELAAPIAPQAEKRIPVTNMTVGAAPEYVKITAALYADGSSAGDAGKVALIAGRRKAVWETTRELIGRIEKAQAAGEAKSATITALKQWADSLPGEGKSRRLTAASVNASASRQSIANTAAHLENGTVAEVMQELRMAERSLATAK